MEGWIWYFMESLEFMALIGVGAILLYLLQFGVVAFVCACIYNRFTPDPPGDEYYKSYMERSRDIVKTPDAPTRFERFSGDPGPGRPDLPGPSCPAWLAVTRRVQPDLQGRCQN